MFYTNNIKEYISKYVKWIRINENKSIREVCLNINMNYRTYKDLEKGIIKKNDEYYDKIQSYYSITFCDNYDLFNECFDFIPQLYNYVELNEDNKILELTKNLKLKISKYKKYAYYKELYYSLSIIYKYYFSKGYMKLDEIYKIIKLMNLWNNELSSILLELCEKSNLILHYSYELSDMLYKNIIVKDAISKTWYARECVMHMNYIEALQLYQELIIYFDKMNNINRKINIQLDEFAIYRDIDQNKALDYIKNIENSLKEDLNSTIKKKANYAIAIFYYFKNDYEKALDYFMKSYNYGNRLSSLLFAYACESKLNKLMIKEKIDITSDISIYIKFFEKKALNIDEKILESYIMDNVLSCLEKERYKEPLWSMFEYEISQIVKKTRNYKKLQIFNEKMQCSLKNAD